MELLVLMQRILVIYLIGTHAIPAGTVTAAVFAKRIRLQYGLLRRLPVDIMQLGTAAQLSIYICIMFIVKCNSLLSHYYPLFNYLQFAIFKVLIRHHKVYAHYGGFHLVACIPQYFMMSHVRGIYLQASENKCI